MSTIQDNQAVHATFRPFLEEWEELEEDDPKTWRKSSSVATFFIAEAEDGITGTGYDFTAQVGDDEIVIEDQRLAATNLDDALDEGDRLITEFFDIGASMLKADEVRLKSAFVFPEQSGDGQSGSFSSIMAVGEDGRLYYFNGQWWEPRSMKIKISAE